MTERLGHHIDGKERTSPWTFVVESPATGETLAEVASGNRDDINDAVAAARAALDNVPPAHERAAALDAVAERIAREREEWAHTICVESAKPIATARVEVDRCVSTLRFAAAEARTMAGDVVPMDASAAGVGKLAFTQRRPVGVIAAITPFNFPLNLVCHKLAPAVAAGCPVVLKTAEKTPLSGHHLAVALEDAGLPPGFINVVHGAGEQIVEPLVTHEDVALVSFTGSLKVGRLIEAMVPGRTVLLELGSNSPLLVMPDADLERVATTVKAGGFSHAGQSCISVQRVLVHRDVHDQLVEQLVAAVDSLIVGDPADDATNVGPLINREAAERVEQWIADAVAKGATLATGGTRTGSIVAPAVVVDPDPDLPIVCEEVFGPVVVVLPFDDLEAGIELANRSAYGLNASIFTNDIGAALTAAERLHAGAVLINESPTYRTDQMPYGGIGDSGTAREGPKYAARDFTVEKLIIINA